MPFRTVRTNVCVLKASNGMGLCIKIIRNVDPKDGLREPFDIDEGYAPLDLPLGLNSWWTLSEGGR